MPLIEKWRCSGRRLLHSFRIFNLREDRYRLPRSDREAPFFILESPDWVNIIPLTAAGEVVLIRQFRFGLAEVTLEIPGGMVEGGLSPLETGRKELLEETGYASEDWEYLGYVHPNPAFLTNRCHTFLARGVGKVAELDPDESEEIEVVMAPLEQIPALIAGEEITHALVIGAFHLLGLNPKKSLYRL
jgi:8-oxo-dGTP pyrophosphatase MutT (NUDIX family)